MSARRGLRASVHGSAFLVGSLCTGLAGAQTPGNLALDRFEAAPAGDRFFAVQNPESEGHGDPRLMVLAEYARDPLVLVHEQSGDEAGTVVSDQLFLHLGAALPLWNRLALSVDVPLALVNTGDSPTGFTSPSGVAAGDLRGGVRLRVLGVGPLQVALAGYVWLPTGDETKFAGAGKVRGSPALVLGGKIGSVVYALNGGVLLAPSPEFAHVTLGPSVTFGGGVGVLAAGERLQIGPELYGSSVMSGDDKFSVGTTSLEGVFGLRLRVGPIVLGAAAGPGLGTGIGTPTVRAVASVTYAPIEQDRDHDGVSDGDDACPDIPGTRSTDPTKNGCPEVPADRDHDGILDAVDACPDTRGIASDDPASNGCPDTDGDRIFDKVDACPTVAGAKNDDPRKNGCPPDRDGDGVLDAVDACPDVAGVASQDPKLNGCPPDRDGDGIADDKDACPDVKGVADPDPAKNGCPPDTDGDGITDDKDACPKDKGNPDPDPKKNGCPRVFVSESRIVILEQVQFKTASDVILKESDDLLSNVARVLTEHPEITKVLVEGHTDNQGTQAYNQNLSERRAASVKKWLVARGKIDTGRLDSKGFGMDRPIAPNDTDDGRQKNRRVEFKIVDQTKPGEATAPGSSPAPKPAGVPPKPKPTP